MRPQLWHGDPRWRLAQAATNQGAIFPALGPLFFSMISNESVPEHCYSLSIRHDCSLSAAVVHKSNDMGARSTRPLGADSERPRSHCPPSFAGSSQQAPHARPAAGSSSATKSLANLKTSETLATTRHPDETLRFLFDDRRKYVFSSAIDLQPVAHHTDKLVNTTSCTSVLLYCITRPRELPQHRSREVAVETS